MILCEAFLKLKPLIFRQVIGAIETAGQRPRFLTKEGGERWGEEVLNRLKFQTGGGVRFKFLLCAFAALRPGIEFPSRDFGASQNYPDG